MLPLRGPINEEHSSTEWKHRYSWAVNTPKRHQRTKGRENGRKKRTKGDAREEGGMGGRGAGGTREMMGDFSGRVWISFRG